MSTKTHVGVHGEAESEVLSNPAAETDRLLAADNGTNAARLDDVALRDLLNEYGRWSAKVQIHVKRLIRTSQSDVIWTLPLPSSL